MPRVGGGIAAVHAWTHGWAASGGTDFSESTQWVRTGPGGGAAGARLVPSDSADEAQHRCVRGSRKNPRLRLYFPRSLARKGAWEALQAGLGEQQLGAQPPSKGQVA